MARKVFQVDMRPDRTTQPVRQLSKVVERIGQPTAGGETANDLHDPVAATDHDRLFRGCVNDSNGPYRPFFRCLGGRGPHCQVKGPGLP